MTVGRIFWEMAKRKTFPITFHNYNFSEVVTVAKETLLQQKTFKLQTDFVLGE